MNTKTLKLSGGYTATIATDMSAENPWKSWDTEPPIMVFNERHLEDYGEGFSLKVIYDCLPLKLFNNHGKILSALDLAESDVDAELPWAESLPDTPEGWRDAIRDCLPDSPTGWRDAIEYFDKAENLCILAGIPCENTESSGYCQGDSARVFVACLPSWCELVGCPPESACDAPKAAALLWGQWAWGDVYGIQSIERPDGTELEDGSVWGFYGNDHKASGLLESAENSVQYDIQQQAKEAAESFRAACADIALV